MVSFFILPARKGSVYPAGEFRYVPSLIYYEQLEKILLASLDLEWYVGPRFYPHYIETRLAGKTLADSMLDKVFFTKQSFGSERKRELKVYHAQNLSSSLDAKRERKLHALFQDYLEYNDKVQLVATESEADFVFTLIDKVRYLRLDEMERQALGVVRGELANAYFVGRFVVSEKL